jgi:hypothetical protein
MQRWQPILSRPCSADSDASKEHLSEAFGRIGTSEELTKLHCLCIPLLARWQFLLSISTLSLSAKP